MIAIFDIALSGARSAMRRLEVSAANVANVRSGAPVSPDGQPGPNLYRPQQLQQASQAQGGVAAAVGPVEPAFTLVPNAEDAVEALPNVNLVHESLEQSLALRSYQANLKVLQAADENRKALLDATV